MPDNLPEAVVAVKRQAEEFIDKVIRPLSNKSVAEVSDDAVKLEVMSNRGASDGACNSNRLVLQGTAGGT